MDVGIRDLKNNLSRHLESVKSGETITVTDHGKPVAKIEPIGELSNFDRLVAEGRITPAKIPKHDNFPEPIEIPGFTHEEMMRLIDEGRGP